MPKNKKKQKSIKHRNIFTHQKQCEGYFKGLKTDNAEYHLE